MAATGGAGMLIRAYINGVATTIGGSRQKSITIGNDPVDVTTSDSASRWQELLGGVAIRKFEVSVEGVLQGNFVDKFVVNAAMSGNPVQFDIIAPNLGTFSGNFIITNYKADAEHTDAAKFSCSIMNTGSVTFV